MVLKNIRTLTLALIVSVTLNVALLASFPFFDVAEPIQQIRSSQKGEMATNAAIFETMSHLTFRELVSFLTNKDLVEEGLTKRDLAVSALTAFHHFNLEKAIAATPSQIRNVSFSETQSIDLFPGLSDDQFEAIIRYAYQEKWPLTAKGLFSLLQKKSDESLTQAFSVTPEFHALQTLFQKTGAPVPAPTLLKLISEGNWETLDQFTREQSQILDFSPEKRRSLLLSYFALRSPTAAELLLRTDFSFALKRLEDRGILDLLSLLPPQTDDGGRFCAELLRSPRSDAVLKKAASLLYTYSGKLPETTIAKTSEPAKPLPKSQLHVVQDGETLWKISRQYKVKVEEIVALNELGKTAVYPGMTLKIP